MRAALIAGSVAGLAGPVFADDARPDPVATRVGQEANLASDEHRQGFVAAVGIGPSLTVGGGTGNGGALQIRLGQVIRPTAVAFLDITGSAQGHRQNGTIHYNDYTTVMGALQFWFAPSGYVRIAAGFGGYQCRQCKDPDDDTNIMPLDYVQRGLAGGTAVGLDITRIGGLVIGVEASGTLTVHRDGAIVGLGSSLVFAID